MTKLFKSICCMILLILLLWIDKDAAAFKSNTVGTDFVFAYINNDYVDSLQLTIIVSNANNQPTNVSVTSIFPSFETTNVIIQPNTIEKIYDIPTEIQARFDEPIIGGSQTLVCENKGIRIQSTLPVAVYAHSEVWSGTSADSFTIIPTVHLGMTYVAVGTINEVSLFPNVIMAVALQDNTSITIGTEQMTLNALQVVTSVVNDAIISGTIIKGNKPFAAFSGNMLGYVNSTTSYVQTTLLPTNIWGTQFALVPFTYVNTNQQYQIVTNRDGTQVNCTDGQRFLLNDNEYAHIYVNESAILSSNFPIQLVQMGQQTTTKELGAPFFLQIPSVDRWISNMTSVLFQPTGSFLYGGIPLMFFVRIYTQVQGIGQILMDNATISALQYRRIAQTQFYYYEMQTTNDAHCILASNSNVTYSVLSYTYGFYKGCGFPVAFSLP